MKTIFVVSLVLALSVVHCCAHPLTETILGRQRRNDERRAPVVCKPVKESVLIAELGEERRIRLQAYTPMTLCPSGRNRKRKVTVTTANGSHVPSVRKQRVWKRPAICNSRPITFGRHEQCPWDVSCTEVDNTRFPPVFYKVSCVQIGRFSRFGAPIKYLPACPLDRKCELVHTEVWLLRRNVTHCDPKTGKELWNRVTEKLPIACGCPRQRGPFSFGNG